MFRKTGGDATTPEGNMKTPLEMKIEAKENCISVFQDGLHADCDGTLFICGRRVTLNEAIMYGGNRGWFSGVLPYPAG